MNKLQKNVQKGFSLIELVIVVAIIATLAGVALPLYESYIIRAKVSEVILTASACRTLITESYQTLDAADLPVAGMKGQWGCESSVPTSQYVASILTNENGAVQVTAQGIADVIDNKTLVLEPWASSTELMTVNSDIGTQVHSWKCGPGQTPLLPVMIPPIPAKYLPGSCRTVSTGSDDWGWH